MAAQVRPLFTDLNTLLMQSTFRIQGQSPQGPTAGTCFLVVVPDDKTPGRGQIVLVTANHVLNEMVGDTAILFARTKVGSRWEAKPTPIQIRVNGRPKWVSNPRADVAAMYTALPEGVKVPFPPSTGLIDDKQMVELEIHPGDELNVLGFPLGYGTDGGSPVLRSGKIASYPLVPTSENPFFLLDFRVFKGNSGGPVYFIQNNRLYGGATHIGSVSQYIVGLVSEEIGMTQQFQGLYENRSETYPLGLAKIIPATFIAETIKQLPPEPK